MKEYNLNLNENLAVDLNNAIFRDNLLYKRSCFCSKTCSISELDVIVHRLFDPIKYINSVSIGSYLCYPEIYPLYNLINISATIVDMITFLEKELKILEKENEVNIFQEFLKLNPWLDSCKEEKKWRNDNSIFSYIRSVLSIHPANTTRHPKANGFNFCRSATIDNGIIRGMVRKKETEIEGNDEYEFKPLLLPVEELFRYIENKYNQIEKIINAIENEDAEIKMNFSNTLVPKEMFDNDLDIVVYLKEETKKRYLSNYLYLFDKLIHYYQIKECCISNVIVYNYFEKLKKAICKYYDDLNIMELNLAESDMSKLLSLKNQGNYELDKLFGENNFDKKLSIHKWIALMSPYEANKTSQFYSGYIEFDKEVTVCELQLISLAIYHK